MNAPLDADLVPIPESGKISRREALRLVAAAAATISVLNQQTFGADAAVVAKPYGTDPLVNKIYKPGDFWPLTLSDVQKRTVKALADLIIPADEKSPAASEVGVVEFLDEWISAPYEAQQADRKEVLEGLVWLERESQQRFSQAFTDLSEAQQGAIADDICFLARAKEEDKQAATFFAKFRNLVAGGFYTTRKGCQDIGYIGNVPLTKFDGPPKAVLVKLGVSS
jgi:Gluconate 2-dehydrogenase subunit 3